jgi:mRNA-degrading endonuclease RelE of RelBE toxin-antitoxin system
MRWGIRYHPAAIQAIYKIERGTAALVTEAIRQLAANPRPVGSEPIPELSNAFSMEVADHTIAYEVREAERLIRIIWIA